MKGQFQCSWGICGRRGSGWFGLLGAMVNRLLLDRSLIAVNKSAIAAARQSTAQKTRVFVSQIQEVWHIIVALVDGSGGLR